MKNVPSIMVVTIVALVVAAALISTRFNSKQQQNPATSSLRGADETRSLQGFQNLFTANFTATPLPIPGIKNTTGTITGAFPIPSLPTIPSTLTGPFAPAIPTVFTSPSFTFGSFAPPTVPAALTGPFVPAIPGAFTGPFVPGIPGSFAIPGVPSIPTFGGP